MRNLAYDNLPIICAKLNSVMNIKESQLEKAKAATKLGVKVDEVADKTTDKVIDVLCGQIYQCFTLVKDDYTNGRINFVTYKTHLEYFRKFLTESRKWENENLHAEEIAKEVKKYISDPNSLVVQPV